MDREIREPCGCTWSNGQAFPCGVHREAIGTCRGCGEMARLDVCPMCGAAFAHDGDMYDLRGAEYDALRQRVLGA